MFLNEKLKSGAKFISINKKDLKSISMVIFIKVGSINEQATEKGMSHFLEHMLFKGTKNFNTPLSVTEALDSMGCEYNAFTDKNMTAYHIKVAKNYDTKAFKILVEIVTQALLRSKDMKMEQQVVVEEFNQMMDNPIRSLIESTLQVMFQGRNLESPVIGYLDTIMNYTNKDLKEYYKKYYVKKNMCIAICGDIRGELKKLVYKKFGSPVSFKKEDVTIDSCCDDESLNKTKYIFKGIPSKFKITQDFKGKTPIILDKRKSQQSHILLSYKIPGIHSNYKWTLHAIKQILAGTMSSRLFQLLREKWGLVYTVSIDILQYDDCGVFCIYAGTETKNCKQVVQIILNEMRKLSKRQIKSDEIKKNLKYIQSNLALENDDSMNIAQYYGIQSLYNLDIQTIDDLIKKQYVISKITPNKIKKVANMFLNRNNLCVSILGNHTMSQCQRFIP